MKSLTAHSFALALICMPGMAQAQHAVRLESATFVERVSTDINGRERRVLAAAGQIARGDRLVFVLRYRNDGARPVSGFAVTNPVPQAVRIDPSDPAMQVSVDGGARWGRLRNLSLHTPLGGTRRATADDITHVRWTVPAPVGPGDGGRISFRGTVR